MSDTIRVVFKSGFVQDFKCSSFKVHEHGCKPRLLEWSQDISPKIMNIDLDEIAMILQVEA